MTVTVEVLAAAISRVVSSVLGPLTAEGRHDRRMRQFILTWLPPAWPLPPRGALTTQAIATKVGLAEAETRFHLDFLLRKNKVAKMAHHDGWFRLEPGHEREAKAYLASQKRGRLVR